MAIRVFATLGNLRATASFFLADLFSPRGRFSSHVLLKETGVAHGYTTYLICRRDLSGQ